MAGLVATTLLVPLQLNAFALTEQCCDSTNYKIAPISQPNYTFLRLHDGLLTSDVLDHVDVHASSPASQNSRVTDLGTGDLRRERLGVYVHWTLPQVYRSGLAGAGQKAQASQTERKRLQGYPDSSSQPVYDSQPDLSMPEFRPIPNRWLVTRRLDLSKLPPNVQMPEFQSWVIESDRITNIDDHVINDKGEAVYTVNDKTDLENEYAPFLSGVNFDPSSDQILEGQAEIFIGKKTPFEKWDLESANAAPKANLTILTSSNPLFADFTHHNMNVFTILDNFMYGDEQNPSYLDFAAADYHVVGWHTDASADPLTTYKDPQHPDAAVPTFATRLTDCMMEMKDPGSGKAPSWLAEKSNEESSRVLCHASMYDVQFSRDKTKQPNHILAADAGTTMKEVQPVSIGTTPLDALLAYCRAHKDNKADGESDNMKILEQDLLRIQLLLHQIEDDDVDGLQAAADESFQQAFQHVEGGTKWFFKQQTSSSAPPLLPTDDQQTDMLVLNTQQAASDNATREAAGLRWSLFAEWWNYVSGFVNDTANYTQRLTAVNNRLNKLIMTGGILSNFASSTTTLQKQLLNPTKGADERFFQRKDPTIMFGSVKRGFDSDFLDPAMVRLSDQAVTSSTWETDSSKVDGWHTFADFIDGKQGLMNQTFNNKSKLPVELKGGIHSLLVEFFELRSSNPVTKLKDASSPQVLPWFHNEDARQETRGRDLWNSTQPWQPLYIEWEAIYYHLPFDQWKFEEHNTLSDWKASAKTVHYGLDGKASNMNIKDVRHVSGRNILIPQASSTLATTLKTIFANTNAEKLADPNGYNMPPDAQGVLLNIVADLEMVSTPMTGLTSHLLTLQEGAHVKPLVRLPNRSPLPINSAAQAIDRVLIGTGMKSRDLISLMDSETSLTPYGSSVAAEADACPMKSVTHGQLMFTKLNIIDKFGQVVHAIDPTPHYRGKPIATITPCISDTFFPGTVDGSDPNDHSKVTTRANCVIDQLDNVSCPCLALTPSINQPARLNSYFVKKINNLWQRCSDWDDPIWGWAVVNYADQGLQLFFPNGTFYREIRLGGKSKEEVTPKYLPFDPPATQPDTHQLDMLIQMLTKDGDPSYLLGFFHMIMQSVHDNSVTTPPSYSTYSSAAVGKPLALVNAGWSLELAGPEGRNWSTANTIGPDRTLLDPSLLEKNPANSTGSAMPVGSSSGYTFPIKLGDADRSFDGLVGYFPAPDKIANSNSDLDLSTLYTEFMDTYKPKTSDPRKSLAAETSPLFCPLQLTPYWLSPDTSGTHDAQLKVFGLIMDPFLPVHAYSNILPNKSLQLPAWCVENALKRMTAFWVAGPLAVTSDVPKTFSEARALDTNYIANIALPPPSTPADKMPVTPTIGLPLPPPAASSSGAGAEYRFLQPYRTDAKTTRYNALAISGDSAAGTDAAVLRLEDGPYTVVEGFIQVAKPLLTDM